MEYLALQQQLPTRPLDTVHWFTNTEVVKQHLLGPKNVKWVNDEVITLTLEVLRADTNLHAQHAPTFIFGSTFLMLTDTEIDSHFNAFVKRYTKEYQDSPKRFAAVDLFLCPYHTGIHWQLLVVALGARTISTADGFRNSVPKHKGNSKRICTTRTHTHTRVSKRACMCTSSTHLTSPITS
jgi:Ulp1 family protease